MNIIKKDLILEELFYSLTAAALIFALLELVWPGVILAYININIVLILWLIVGIVLLAKKNKKSSL